MKGKSVIFVILFTILIYGITTNANLNSKNSEPVQVDVAKVEKMIDSLQTVDDVLKRKIALSIVANGDLYKISHKELVAVAFVESKFDPTVINKSGDHGLMQVNWKHWGKRYVQKPTELMGVYKNVEIACKIVNQNRHMGFKKISSYHSLYNTYAINVYEQKINSALRRIQ